MPEFLDFQTLLNSYNLTGVPSSLTLKIPLQEDIDPDNDQHYMISYSYFKSSADIDNSGYYPMGGPLSFSLVDNVEYKQNIENAIESILNPSDPFSVLFTDIANIDFQLALNGTGIITFAQLNNNNPFFPEHSATSAFTPIFDPDNQNALIEAQEYLL